MTVQVCVDIAADLVYMGCDTFQPRRPSWKDITHPCCHPVYSGEQNFVGIGDMVLSENHNIWSWSLGGGQGVILWLITSQVLYWNLLKQADNLTFVTINDLIICVNIPISLWPLFE